MTKKTFAEIMLIFTAIIWALTYPFIKAVVTEIDPVVLIFWRGSVAAIIFGLFLLGHKIKTSRTSSSSQNDRPLRKIFFAGLLLGFWYYVSYTTQAIGLETIDSGRSAFITSLFVIFVPILSPFFRGSPPTKNDVISCFIAFMGLTLLTDPLSQKGLKIGDVWTIVCAFAFAVQIHLLQIYTRQYQSYGAFAFLQSLFIGVFAALTIPASLNLSALQWLPTTRLGIYGFIYLVLFSTVATTWLQARFQHDTTAERASVIFVSEPVFALIFGFLVLHEVPSFISLIGAGIMMVSVLWSFIIRALKNSGKSAQG